MTAARVIKLAAGEDGSAWSDALSRPNWRDGAELLKRDGGVSVWRAELLGRVVVVKCWSLDRLKRRLQVIVGATPAVRQWRGAAWLQEHEIPTADPFVIVRTTLDGQLTECLVMRALIGETVLDHLAGGDLTIRQEHALARLIGRQIAQITLHNRFNRDHKPSNLIVTRTGDSTPIVAVIDSVAIRRATRSLDHLCSMLADLAIEPTGCGCPPRRTLAMRCVLEALAGMVSDGQPKDKDPATLRNEVWAAVMSVMARRGNLTPRIDPLADVRRTDG
ncbi:MAG: hypothetical protein IID31_02720 [Planctomycetes bacterium]|nr:hypothetical protein [Planctomycetota bacterium]